MKISILSPIEILHRLVKTEETKPENTQVLRSLPVGKITAKNRANNSDTQIDKDKKPQQKTPDFNKNVAAAASAMMPQTRLDTEKIRRRAGKKQAKNEGCWVMIEYQTQHMENTEITAHLDSGGLYVSIVLENENAKNLLSENIGELINALEKRYKIRSISVQKRVKTDPKTIKNESKTTGLDLRI